MTAALLQSSIKSLPLLARGKVRDMYAVGKDKLLIVASDRISAFDVILDDPIPGKGQVLKELTDFWLARLAHVLPNHSTGIRPEDVVAPDERDQVAGRAVVVKRLTPILVEAVARGVDMFDCVLPTRSGRHGQAWTRNGPVNLKTSRFADDDTPLDATIDCPASRDYSKAYLHHLVKAEEILGQILLSWHNLAFFQQIMSELRAAIRSGTLDAYRQAFRTGLN